MAEWFDIYPKDKWKDDNYSIMKLFSLKGKKGFITGGCGGLGRNVAAAWAENGADVALVDLPGTKDRMEVLCKELSDKYGTRVIPIYCDVSDPDSVKAMKEELLKEFGNIDLAYVNAGICMMGDDVNVPYDTWKKTLDVNLDGIYLCAMAAKEIMVEKEHGGSIVMTSSLSGFAANNAYGNPTPVCAYGTSKAGVYEFSRFMAASLARNGIRVNSVSPGYVWSGIHEGVMDKDGHDMLLMPVPMKKFGLNEDIASAVTFLSSDAAKYITGTVIHVDGGYSVF